MSVDINGRHVQRVSWRARTSQETSDSEWSDDDNIYENTGDLRQSMPAPALQRDPVSDYRLPVTVTAGTVGAVENKEELGKPVKSNSARKKFVIVFVLIFLLFALTATNLVILLQDRVWSSGDVNVTNPPANTNSFIGSMDRISQGKITTASSTTTPLKNRRIVDISSFDALKNLVEVLQDQLESSKQNMTRLARQRDSDLSQIKSQNLRYQEKLQDQLGAIQQNLTTLSRQRDSDLQKPRTTMSTQQIVDKSTFDGLKNLVEELQEQLKSGKQDLTRLASRRDSEITQIKSQTSSIQDQLEADKQNLATLTRRRDSEISDINSQTSRIRVQLDAGKQNLATLTRQKNDEIAQIQTQASRIENRVVAQKTELESKIRKVARAFGDIRLVGGGSASGRVEIYHDGSWGTICDDDWGVTDAKVVCRMLGYDTATSAPQSATYGQGSGEIWLDDVACTGDEYHIALCSHRGWGVGNCNHGEDASAVCA